MPLLLPLLQYSDYTVSGTLKKTFVRFPYRRESHGVVLVFSVKLTSQIVCRVRVRSV